MTTETCDFRLSSFSSGYAFENGEASLRRTDAFAVTVHVVPTDPSGETEEGRGNRVRSGFLLTSDGGMSLLGQVDRDLNLRSTDAKALGDARQRAGGSHNVVVRDELMPADA